MPRSTWVQSNFNGGEWSPLAWGRYDLAKSKNGLALCQCYIPMQQGGLTRRPGFLYVANVKDSTYAPRLQRFEFSITQAYVMELGNLYSRFYTKDGQLQNTGAPVEATTPYLAADVWSLNFAQSADTLYIAHGKYPPAKLQRASAYVWNYTPITFLDGPYLPVNTTATTLTPTQATASTGGTASFAGTVMTLVAAPTVGSIALNQTVWGVGLLWNANITILALTGGVLNAPGSTYQISVSSGTVSTTAITTYAGVAPGTTCPVVASGTTGINGGAGFRATDVGRALRIKCGGVWLWGTISVVTDTKNISWAVAAATGAQVPTTATASANISGGSVFGVTVTNGGGGYAAQPPSVTFAGGGGSGAVGYANLTNGVVTSVTISVTGSGYTSAPSVSFTTPAGIVPSSTTFWRLGLYNSTDGYPTTVIFHQDRLIWGGAPNSPGRLDGSNSGDYENYAPTNLDGTVVDSNAISYTLNAGQVNAIQWLGSDEQGLLVGTAGGEWAISPGNASQALTPSNVNARLMGNYGSAAVPPLRVGKQTLFIQRTGRKIRELTYQFMYNTFQALDISLLGEHLTKGGLKQMALQLAPQQIVWVARKDGALVAFTYDKDQETLGWHRQPVGGFSDAAQTLPALVESVASMPAPDITRDEVWAVVNRYVNGQTQRTIEVMGKMWEDGDVVQNANFLDSSARYTGAPTTTVSGLTWLAGQPVGVLVDGAVHSDCVVSSAGAITLNYAGSNIFVGLKYTSAGRTLNIESGGADGPSQGKTKRAIRAMFKFFQSIGMSLGSATPGVGVDAKPWRSDSDPMGSQVALFDGYKRWSYDGTWSDTGDIYFEVSDPLPSNITQIVVQLDTQDNQ